MDKLLTLRLGHFIVLFSGILLGSCVYDTDEVYQSPANKDAAPPVITTVKLDFETEDTIFIYSPEELNFSFSSSDQAIEAVSLTIDNDSPQVVSSASGKFNFNRLALAEGNHAIKLEVFTSSGTGSIAEKVGAEHFVSTRTWVLVNEKPNVHIDRVIENGLQKISWKACRSKKLVDYVVYCQDKVLATVKTNYFIDSTYVGEARAYSISARLKEDETLPWGSLSLLSEMPVFRFSVSKDNVYMIHWNKSKYYNAIDTIKILHHSFYNTQDIILKSTADLNDTTAFVDPSYFGESLSFTFRLVPKKVIYKNDWLFYDRYNIRKNFLIGQQFIYCNQVFPISKDLLLVDAFDSIMTYSISENKITGKFMDRYFGDDVIVSPQGTYFAGALHEKRNYFYSPTDQLNSPTMLSLPYQPMGIISNLEAISDNGLGIEVVDYRTINLYELSTSRLLASYRNENLVADNLKMSPKGDYFLTNYNALYLFQIINGQIKMVRQTADFWYYDFVSTADNQYVTWDGAKLYVKQLPQNSIVRELPISDLYIINIDYYNNEMLTYSNGQLYVRSFIDGHIIHQMATKLDEPFIYRHLYLQNHVLFNKLTGISYIFNQE
ncbi:MAG: hypothetical protein ACM3PR_10215 [Bacteroidales bacterium]